MCVGVGIPDGWASFATPETAARGEISELSPETPSTAGGVVDFFCGGEPTEIGESDLVPFEQVLTVAAHFMETHDVPQEMRWS